jgi:hypothetical protein
MLKTMYTRTIAFAPALLAGCLTVGAMNLPAKSTAPTAPTAVIANSGSAVLSQHHDELPALDSRRLFALGMIETGNDDRAIGRAGEISRYQLAPPVWRSYSRSMEYRNPDVSWQVARLHWNYLAAYFKDKTGRMPTDFDMYVLWNTRYGYYAHKSFSRRQLATIVQDRAQRFVNLVNR